MKRVVALIVACASVASALAQENDEIIVTGARISRYESDILPVIHQTKRADFLVAEVTVESDSREYKLRRDEVLKTLQSMADRADREPKIDLGILKTFDTDDDEIRYVAPFTRAALNDQILSGGARSDTTQATIIVKTPVSATDTVESAKARLDTFAASVPETGRAQVANDDDPGLSIVDIAQYRAPLLAALAADNAAVRARFGDDYRVTITGLEQPVRWRLTGPLELAIYFPYTSSAAPR